MRIRQVDDNSKEKQNIVDIKVRFSEIDCLDIANNAQYLTWFEIGRLAFIENVVEVDPVNVVKKYRFPVLIVHCKFLKSVHLNEEISIETKVYKESPKVEFFYTLRNVSGEICALGMTSHSYVDDKGQVHVDPDNYLDSNFDRGMEKDGYCFLDENMRKKQLEKILR